MSEDTNNLKFWDSVREANPQHTKYVATRGGFTSISAMYQVRMATEQWGPMGDKWGVELEKFTPLALCAGGQEKTEILYTAQLYYPTTDSVQGHIELHSNIAPGPDFAKKAATDALTKGLSKLGFAADIFMGMWDDDAYVEKMCVKFDVPVQDKKGKRRAPRQRPAGNALIGAAKAIKVIEAFGELGVGEGDLVAFIGHEPAMWTEADRVKLQSKYNEKKGA